MHIIVDGRKVPTTELVILGGRVGQVQIEVHSMYGLLVPNQRYLLFFGSGRTEGQLYVGAAFRVVGQNIVAQEKMIEQGQMTQPQVTMPLSQVEAQLRTNCR